MTADALRSFLARWIPIEAAGPYGEIQQRERLAAVAEFVAAKCAGDFVEIGVLHGSTTVLLAEVARRCGRKVIAIDPFEVGTQNCTGAEMGIFLKNIQPYADVVEFLRMRSDDWRVRPWIGTRHLAFAFVDGLHEYATCLHDIAAVSHAAVIAVDDTKEMGEVRAAFADAAVQLARPGRAARDTIVHTEFRESWMV